MSLQYTSRKLNDTFSINRYNNVLQSGLKRILHKLYCAVHVLYIYTVTNAAASVAFLVILAPL